MKKTGWRFPEGNPCLDFVRGNWKAVVLSLSTAWEPDSVWAITVWFGLRVRHHLGQCPDCREVYYFRKRKRIGGNLQIVTFYAFRTPLCFTAKYQNRNIFQGDFCIGQFQYWELSPSANSQTSPSSWHSSAQGCRCCLPFCAVPVGVYQDKHTPNPPVADHRSRNKDCQVTGRGWYTQNSFILLVAVSLLFLDLEGKKLQPIIISNSITAKLWRKKKKKKDALVCGNIHALCRTFFSSLSNMDHT